MLSLFFNGKGQFVIDVLPKGMKRDTDDFADNIIPELGRLCSPQGRRSSGRRVMLHVDNAPIHCTGTIQDRMAVAELERIEHPPYNPDLTPYDFFLFGCVKGK
jgi:hypothetical protein